MKYKLLNKIPDEFQGIAEKFSANCVEAESFEFDYIKYVIAEFKVPEYKGTH